MSYVCFLAVNVDQMFVATLGYAADILQHQFIVNVRMVPTSVHVRVRTVSQE